MPDHRLHMDTKQGACIFLLDPHMIGTWFRSLAFLNEDARRRVELTRLARDRRHRLTKSTPARPSRWQPASVCNPDDRNKRVSPTTALGKLVASKLEIGHRIQIMELQKPKGATGYVMQIRLDSSPSPLLYVKAGAPSRLDNRKELSLLGTADQPVAQTLRCTEMGRAPA